MATQTEASDGNSEDVAETEDRDTVQEDSASGQKKEYRVYKTCCLYLSTVCLGLFLSILGPTLLNLIAFLDTDLERISLAVLARAVGFLVGSVLVGLTIDSINQELFFFVSTAVLGISLGLAPAAGNVYGFIVCYFFCGIIFGVIIAGGQTYVLSLWSNSKWKGPSTQGFHSAFAVGGIFGPLIAAPFLVEMPETQTQSPPNVTLPPQLTAYTKQHLGDGELNNNFDTGESLFNESSFSSTYFSSVKYPYFISGAFGVLCSLMFLAVLIKEHQPVLKRKQRKMNAERESNSAGPCTNVNQFSCTVLALCFIFQFFYSAISNIPNSFFPAFLIKGLGWSVVGAARLSSVKYAGFLAGRLAGIPASFVMSPFTMLLIVLPLASVGFLSVCFLQCLPTYVTYISIFVPAFAMGSITASLFLWVSNYLLITGRAAAVFIFGIGFGDIAWQPLTARMFETTGPLSVAYITFAASVILLVLFGLLHLTFKCCSKPSTTLDTGTPDVKMQMMVSEDVKETEE